MRTIDAYVIKSNLNRPVLKARKHPEHLSGYYSRVYLDIPAREPSGEVLQVPETAKQNPHVSVWGFEVPDTITIRLVGRPEQDNKSDFARQLGKVGRGVVARATRDDIDYIDLEQAYADPDHVLPRWNFGGKFIVPEFDTQINADVLNVHGHAVTHTQQPGSLFISDWLVL